MALNALSSGSMLHWQDAALDLSLAVDESGIARLLVAAGASSAGGEGVRLPFGDGAVGLPLLDVLVGGQGS